MEDKLFRNIFIGALLILLAAMLCVGGFYFFTKEKQPSPAEIGKEKAIKPMTQEEIDAILSGKSAPGEEAQPISGEEIGSILSSKAEASEEPKPMSQDEINKILNSK